MREITTGQLDELVKAHMVSRLRDSDLQEVRDWYDLEHGFYGIRLSDMYKARPKVLEHISKYSHLGLGELNPKMTKEDIEQFKEGVSTLVPLKYDSMVAKYSGIDEADLGGYVSKDWRELPLDVRKLFVKQAAGTKMKIIEGNGYRSHDDTNFMIEEMLGNAEEHGNSYDRNKDVYLLWHRCGDGKEVYIIDEGEKEFDFDKQAERRAELGRAFSNSELSGTNLLRAYSKSFEYFSVVDNEGNKKGTVLKIVLSEETEPCGNCDYIGKQIFETNTS
jgi:anti-sigma regulatory factor (Ser/Thr protein kinase)